MLSSGSDLDEKTKTLIERGRRATEILKQPQYAPLSVAEEVVVLYAVTRGFLDTVPVTDINRFESELLSVLRNEQKALPERITSEKALSEDLEGELKAFLEDFVKTFSA